MKLPELEELYRRYRMDLYRYLCFLTHDPVQAEDLLSETLCGSSSGCPLSVESAR